MNRSWWTTFPAWVALGNVLNLWSDRPVQGKAVHVVPTTRLADQASPSSSSPEELGEGAFRFEVEPDDVEIYLDEHYLGRAGELRGRAVGGILPGNRLLELRLGGERTFLQVVVPVNETRTIRLKIGPSASKGS